MIINTSDRITEAVKRRYNRYAPVYDLIVGRFPDRWWKLLWSRAEDNKILKVGVGTGKSFPFYPPDTEVTAVPVSMLPPIMTGYPISL